MKKSAIIFTMFLCMAFFAYNALAENGCCLNPNTDVCVVSAGEICCPPDPNNYSDPNGPDNETACKTDYFSAGGEDACLILSGNKANLCTQGCCCQQTVDTDGNAVVNVQPSKYKLECQGESFKWLGGEGECNETRCNEYFTSKKVTEVCDPLAQANECTQEDDWPLNCIQSILVGNVINTEYFCCHEFECAVKEIGEEETKNFCLHPGESIFTDKLKCFFGQWYDSNKTIEHAELCQDVVNQTTSLHFSDMGICNNQTCAVTLIRELGQCKENETCKASPYDENYKVCCNQSQCGYYDLETKKCANDQEEVTFTKNGANSTYKCNNSNWELVTREPGTEDAPCISAADCKGGFSCLSFICEKPEFNNYFGKSFCCNATTQCAGGEGCIDIEETLTIESTNKFNCVPPTWETVNTTPKDPNGGSGGGGCGGTGSNGGVGTDPGAGGDNTPALWGESCKDKECAEGLYCKIFLLPSGTEVDPSDLAAVQEAKNNLEAQGEYCCKDGECGGQAGCAKENDEIVSAYDQKTYKCTGGVWEYAGLATDGETVCDAETQCKLPEKEVCIGATTGENYFIDAIFAQETAPNDESPAPEDAPEAEEAVPTAIEDAASDFKDEQKLAREIAVKNITGANLYTCKAGEEAKLVKTCKKDFCTGGCVFIGRIEWPDTCCQDAPDVATPAAAAVAGFILLGSRFRRKKTAKK